MSDSMPTRQAWFSARAAGRAAEIEIFEEIGLAGVTARDFSQALKSLGPVERMDLRINSPGGDPHEATTIHHLIKRHPGRVAGTIESYVASAASIVAMAADELEMPRHALLMIHEARLRPLDLSSSEELEDLAHVVRTVNANMASIFAARTGLPVAQIRQMMAETTWMDGEEALALGFVDRVSEAPVRLAAHAAFASYRNAPARLVPAGRASSAGAGAITNQTAKEIVMSDQPEGAEAQAAATTERSNTTSEAPPTDKSGRAGRQPLGVETPEEMAARIRAEVETELRAKLEDEANLKPQYAGASGATGDAGAAASEPVAEIEARVRREVAAEHKQIFAACEIAGVPGKAVEFIDAGKPLADALAELRAIRAAAGGGRTSTAAEISARHGGPAANAAEAASWDRQIERINARAGTPG